MIGFCPLASGSKGNCFYLGTKECKILIDLGISKSSVISKLAEIRVHPEDIQAILVTHEHSDHIDGIKTFSKTFGTPIIANMETAKALVRALEYTPKCKIFSTGSAFTFQDLTIHPFNVSHDAIDPVGFTFTYKSEKLGFCTDVGTISSLLILHLLDCDYLVIEANHEPNLVHSSTSRPFVYKKRVLSKLGHLSNDECGELLKQIISPKLKHLYLVHLSMETNTESLAFEKVCSHISDITPVLPKLAKQSEVSAPIFFTKSSTKLAASL